MLQIVVPPNELWDEQKQEFIATKEQKLQLEHSLVSLSRWESIFHKPFISKTQKTVEEIQTYIKCMTISQNVDPDIYKYLTDDVIDKVNKYIDNPMTATFFSEEENKATSQEQITAELVYFWMISLNIPFECQKWHLNRLLVLIKICTIKNQPNKKKSKKEIMTRNAALNASRRKRLNTKG